MLYPFNYTISRGDESTVFQLKQPEVDTSVSIKLFHWKKNWTIVLVWSNNKTHNHFLYYISHPRVNYPFSCYLIRPIVCLLSRQSTLKYTETKRFDFRIKIQTTIFQTALPFYKRIFWIKLLAHENNGCPTATISRHATMWIKTDLTHCRRDKMAAIFQTTISNTFSWIQIYKFRLIFHWNLFPGVQSIIFQHCSDIGLAPARRQDIIWTNDG